MRSTVPALLLLVGFVTVAAGLALLGGCGKDAREPSGGGPAPPANGDRTATSTPPSTIPDDPDAALAWIREARILPDEEELRRRLYAWPMDDERFVGSEAMQVVLTWRIRVALQAGAIERAVDQWKLLVKHFDGHGVSPEGRGLTPEMIRLGLIEEARLVTRRRAEGANPKPSAAESAWKHGADLLTKHDVEDGDRLERARRWALWDTFERWCREVGMPPGPALGRGDGSSEDAKPFVVVVADDFALGEVVFQSVLARWVRDGADAQLTGVLIPIKRGEVRMQLRRVPAGSEAEEVAALEEDAAKAGLQTTFTTASGLLAAPFDDGARLARAIGLEGREAAVMLVDRRGRIVGRMSGTGLDPRALDPVVQKLVSR